MTFEILETFSKQTLTQEFSSLSVVEANVEGVWGYYLLREWGDFIFFYRLEYSKDDLNKIVILALSDLRKEFLSRRTSRYSGSRTAYFLAESDEKSEWKKLG